MTNCLPQHFPFITFKTKQNVSKSKLGGEFAKKGWNDFSNGFSENTSIHIEERGELIKNQPKIDPKIFKKEILAEKCKPKKRISMFEHEEDFFTSKAKDLCSLIQKKSLLAENQKDLKTCNLNKCPSSVFLEVQNIQNSFLQNKSTSQPNICLKLPNLNRNFIADLAATKAAGQENVPKKSRASMCQFSSFQENDFSHSVPVKKVKKANVMANLSSSLATMNPTVPNNLSKTVTDSKPVSSYSKENHCKIKVSADLKLHMNTRKVFLDQNQNKIVSILEDDSSKNKGSDWVHSLQPSATEDAQEDTVVKKRIRNILPGGFAEQLLKLQRLEKSEKVIWDHLVDKNKRKEKCLSLVLLSFSSSGDMVIAKCQSLQTERSTESTELHEKESDQVSTESRRVVVLLKKNVFNKLHLKVSSIFYLYPPWQTLHLPFISCPVLCAKFIESEAKQDNILYDDPISTSSISALTQESSSFNDQWEHPITLSGRVQRIVKREMSEKDLFPFTRNSNYFRYSLLIQEQNGEFYELLLTSAHILSGFWNQFIAEAEGRCYKFHDLHVIRRFCLKKCQSLFRILQSLSKSQFDGNGFQQKFCYQLVCHSHSAIPEVVSEQDFPAYSPVSVQPLASLCREKSTLQTISCFVKVIFQFNQTLYVCDDSIPRYVQLESLFPVRSKSPLVDSLVFIRDAQLLEGCLFLDNYSSFVQITEESQMDESLKELLRSRWNQLMNVTLQNVVPSINAAHENDKFVFIKGEVTSVDTSNALSWLQCNICFGDNLVQDSRLDIYCENCLQIVPKPVLNVKMSVTCQCSTHVMVDVELLSNTIKGILQISDNIHQPQCNVDDILGKQVGPLLCRINDSTSVGDVKHFRATEVDTS